MENAGDRDLRRFGERLDRICGANPMTPEEEAEVNREFKEIFGSGFARSGVSEFYGEDIEKFKRAFEGV